MFRDRADAARQLAARLKEQKLHNPVVLAIPRGGVAIGVVLARELDSDLDIVPVGKLRVDDRPDIILGAITEDGVVTLGPTAGMLIDTYGPALDRARVEQMAGVARRRKLFREVQRAIPLAGRTVIVTDDGVSSGATMIAALRFARAQKARELIAAAPVMAPDRTDEIRKHCNSLVAVTIPREFHGIASVYTAFPTVTEEEAVELLRQTTRGKTS